MASEYITKTVDREIRELVRTWCDWCSADIEYGTYDVRDVTLEFATGSAYPDGGYKEGWQVEDLCDSCGEKLRTLLQDHGITVIDLEVDW